MWWLNNVINEEISYGENVIALEAFDVAFLEK